ncbi:hypothetical protein SDC9_97646 [bioreactor metagenome]|uniref:PQ-loop repeat-containing protein n=1 Tax=bioreactor metagenome TaxID=1076179 RepID=A0A645ACL6_9ZZZZ|nr:hypothetical protein [Oscillospiraceae bacterium]
MPEILETIMMICFGVSWPVSVYKSYKARSAKGKSIAFLMLIEFGYSIGLIGKIIYNPGYVIAVYICNMVFVMADIVLYYRNRKLDKVRD